jgi:hypothetical protein
LRNISLLVAIGVNESGYREILGICEGAKEDKTGWSAFLKFFPEAAWQRYIVHWYRNIFSHVPSTKVREITALGWPSRALRRCPRPRGLALGHNGPIGGARRGASVDRTRSAGLQGVGMLNTTNASRKVDNSRSES